MNSFVAKFGKLIFLLILFVFAVAFFIYSQYWLCFFTLALMLVVSRWDKVKKIVVGKEKIEVQIPESIVENEAKPQDNAKDQKV